MTTTRRIKAGTTDVSVVIRIIDSGDGTPETGVVFNTSGIDLEYRRELEASTDITEATLAALTTAHTDGGFLHVGNGYYRLDLPDAACAAGATGVLVHGIVTGMVVIGTYIELVAYDPYDTVRLGLTALPNAAAQAAGGLYTRGTGAGQINQPANGLIDVNVENWNTTAVPAEHTAGYPIVTVKDGTGTGELDTASGLVLANVTQLGGSTQSATDLKDFADDGYDPATNKVQGVVLVDTLTTYTGNTPQTGDSFARLGAPAGASVSADIAAIEAQTDDIGAAGAGLTAVPWNSTWDAEVQSEVDDALVAQNLDHLVKIAVDTDFATTVHLNSVVGHLADNGTAATFDRTTDSLEALQGVSAPSAATIADAVWDETLAGHLGAGSTGEALNAAGAAGDPWVTALPGAYGAGSAGKIIGDNVNATISSRASQASVDTIDDFVDTEIAAIKAKTDNLPADPADASDIAASFTTVNGKLDVIDDFLDTEVAAIKVVTDALPNGGALTTIQSDLDDIQARLPAALVSGRMDASVGAMAAGVVTPAAIATDAIDSDAIAANAITEIQNGLATSAALTTLTNYVDTEIGTLQTDVSSILADTGTDGVVVATASKTGYALSAAGIDEIFDELRAGHSVAGSYGESFFTLESGAAIAGTLSTTQMSTNLTEATDDHFKGRIIIFTSGALLRQATDITAYNGTTKIPTFTALTEAPVAGDRFVIV